MISRMKKVTVICIREHQEASLLALQRMGVLHLEHIKEPGGSLLEETRAHLSDVKRAADVLEHYAAEAGEYVPSVDPRRTPESVVDEVWTLINQRKEHDEDLDHWQREVIRIAPFGSFDPVQVKELAEKGFYIGLYKAGPKEDIHVPENASLHIHERTRDGVRFSVISREPLDLSYESIPLPSISMNVMRQRIQSLKRDLEEIHKAFAALAGYYPLVKEIVDQTEDEVRFLEARTGMGTVEPLAYLQGYCPEAETTHIQSAAAKLGWGILIQDVTSEDRVPTRIENPAWVRPIRTVFSFIGVVPGYDEVDISALFLLFFSLFFGMIVGDAGYGAIFLGATWLARRKFKQAPASPFHLLYITSGATILWGILTGNYFGIEALPGVMEGIRIDWLADDLNIMGLCFLIGAIHLTLAHLWNVYRNRHSLQALAQVGWICIVWSMFFLARMLVLNADFPSFMGPIFGIGIVLLVLFMTPFNKLKEEAFNHVMLPLNLVSNFVDVVSYVRLFAVGTATFAVASAFNEMGGGIMGLGWVGGLIGAIIIFLGHTLNILLAIMGVLVHGIRLNTLEFAGHLGLQWTGIPFAPFRRIARRERILNDQSTELKSEA